MSAQQQEASRATSGYIPSGGGLITADFYVTSPEGKQSRVKVPYESMDWLVKKLNDQGSAVDKIGELPLSAQATLGQEKSQEESQMLMQPQTQGQQAPMQQGPGADNRQAPMVGS
jgi:hypothetical protein